MFNKIIFIFLFGYVYCEYRRIWKVEEAKVSLFRRTPKPSTFQDVLHLPPQPNFTNITWTPSGHVWFIYDEKKKEWKQVYKPTFTVVYSNPSLFSSAWLFVKDTCSDIVVAVKSFVIESAKLTFYLGRKLIPI